MDTSQPAGVQRIAVIIPVLNAARYLPGLLAVLHRQRPRPPDAIILVDSGSTDGTAALVDSQPDVTLLPLGAPFTHGGARNRGVTAAADAETVVLMTQDAMPSNDGWLAALLAPLADEKVGAVYSRQVPRPGTNPMERFFLEFRFPDAPAPVTRKVQGRRLTMDDIFFSNVSAAIRRSLLAQYPFDERLIMSEDQRFIKTIMEAGWSVAYQPASVVVHSHNYSLAGTFRRYFDSVCAFRQIFPDHTFGSSSSVGTNYIRHELGYVARHAWWWLPYYFCYNAAKALATLAAHNAQRLPRRLARRLSLNRAYWET